MIVFVNEGLVVEPESRLFSCKTTRGTIKADIMMAIMTGGPAMAAIAPIVDPLFELKVQYHQTTML